MAAIQSSRMKATEQYFPVVLFIIYAVQLLIPRMKSLLTSQIK